MEKMRDSRESASGRAGGVSPSRVSIVDEKTLSSTVSQRRLSVQEVAKKLVQEKSRTFLTKRKESVNEFKQELSIDDHIVSLPELSKRYEVDLELGHSEEKALELLSKNGPNALRPPKLKSRWVLFLQYMFYGFSSLLWIGALMSIGGYVMAKLEDAETSMDQLYLGIVIVVVILITGVFGFYQESANSAIMESFKKMIPKNATVVREGGKYVIPSEQIVLGDLVQVKAGDCVPADIRIILAVSLKVDNSSITGESEPQARLAEMTDMNPLETANLAFYGTNVVEGSGVGVVIACGDNTLMGHIAALTSGLVPEKTPIKKELSRFTLIVTIIALVCGAVFFGICLLLGYTFFEAFLYFIAVCVANVPEGLLVTMTACLTLTARKMARKNCLCKNLLAIETLGSTTVICSDKTGTLTQNRMTVSHMYYDSVVYDVMSETKYYNENSTAFKLLCRVGILCSRAEFKPNQEEVDVMKREVIGDASESAVIKCMELLVGQTDSIRHEYEKIFEIPFNSTNKYQISIHKIPNSEGLLLVMKGAPERLIERSSHMFTNEGVEEISAKTKKKLKMALLEIGYMGERVLGFADLELPPEYNAHYTFTSDPVNFPVSGLRFMGYMSMIDPPRPGVPMAVQKCKSAGIKVVMVTGDHPITAMAIARKVGIISPQNETVHDIAMRRNVSANKITEAEVARCKASVITGTELREMDDEDLADVIRKYEEIVFARTSPQQKLQIVEAFQKAKNIVAVTGDGVNDSPALKKADIGIAMGITGSDVSKEAADMIILDDNFASIVIGIEEGRLIFDNLKKSIAYMFTSNVPELVPFLLHVIIGIPLPLSIMAILVIDVGTDLWPGISLAYEIAEADIMHKKPRNPKRDRLVSAKLLYFANFNIGIIQAFAGLTCYFYVMAEHGFLPERLLWIREEWMSERNDLKDSYSIEWTREERIVLEKKCYSAFFMAVVMTQIADCIICKTRRLSIVEQGMSNVVMNCGLLFEVVLAFLVVYCPGLNSLLGFEPVRLYVMVPGLPFALMIIAFDEIRKYFIRTRPGGFMERETAF